MERPLVDTVVSPDGTAIALDIAGDGPPVILVNAGPTDRTANAPLAGLLARHFRVLNYDRRGRGDSGDTAPYAVDREYEDRRGDMVELFLTQAVGMPAEFVAPMRQSPFWPSMEAVAHALVYDAMIVGDFWLPTARLATVKVPTLVLDGGQSSWLSATAEAVAAALPDVQRRTLAGQPHNVDAAALAPALTSFFAA